MDRMAKKKQEIIETVINKMFEIAGHNVTYNDIKDRKDEWYLEYTMTEKQREEWRNWSVPYIRKKRRWMKKTAELEFAMLDLYCGLKIVD